MGKVPAGRQHRPRTGVFLAVHFGRIFASCHLTGVDSLGQIGFRRIDPAYLVAQRFLMRIVYLFLLVLFSASLKAQVRWAPLGGNAALENLAQEREASRRAELYAQTGLRPPARRNDRNGRCGLQEENTFYVLPGQEVIIPVDTVGLPGAGEALVIEPCDPLQFGFLDDVNDQPAAFQYLGNTDVEGGGDTICISFGSGDDRTAYRVPIVVSRLGTAHTLPVETVQEATTTTRCIDYGLLPGEPVCVRTVLQDDTYEGNDERIVYLADYDALTECIIYQSARFPGLDEVGLEVCDEFAICDTFFIPFQIETAFAELPFFDDFSYDQLLPSSAYWLDYSTYVNRTLADNPPSVGLVTFDALDGGGRPYESAIGFADRLSSRPLDLSGFDADELNLKFYAAPKGLGNPPNALDSLRVEFYTVDREWETVWIRGGFESPPSLLVSTPFDFYVIDIDEARWLHGNFRFRFQNQVSAEAGFEDFWHVDYVRLAANEGDAPTFQDVAYTLPADHVLDPLTAMPYRHFAENPTAYVRGEYGYGLFNHFSVAQNLDESGVFFREATTGAEAGTVFATPGNALNLPSRENVVDAVTISDPDALQNFLVDNAFSDQERLEVETIYTLRVDGQTADFERNDTVRTTTVFDNYFAYDDGTAELAIFLSNGQGSNPELAVEHVAEVADSLRAIRFHFPRTNGDVSNQLFNIKVWLDDIDSEPAYTAIFQKPLYISAIRDSLNGFTTYLLADDFGTPTPLFLPAGSSFFIGWQQVSAVADAIPVGYDINGEGSGLTQFRVGADWQPLSELPDYERGAVMIRPVVGNDDVRATSNTREVGRVTFGLSPNPATEVVQLQLPDAPTFYRLRAYNQLGQLLLDTPATRQFSVADWRGGIYFVELTDTRTQVRTTQRLVVGR